MEFRKKEFIRYEIFSVFLEIFREESILINDRSMWIFG